MVKVSRTILSKVLMWLSGILNQLSVTVRVVWLHSQKRLCFLTTLPSASTFFLTSSRENSVKVRCLSLCMNRFIFFYFISAFTCYIWFTPHSEPFLFLSLLAFVTLLNGEQAQCAIKEFHQIMLRDREISVQLQPTDALLCIANLPRAFTQQQFEELVRPFGNLERCFLVYSASTGHSKGYGFVEYMKKDSAARAKSELLGKQLGSRMLYVHWTEVGSLTYPQLHSKCLCVDRLPPSLLTAQDLRNALADTHSPVFCQVSFSMHKQSAACQVNGFQRINYPSTCFTVNKEY